VEVDEAWHEDPWPQVEGGGGFGRMVAGWANASEPARGVDLDERVYLVAGTPGGKRSEEPSAEREGRPLGQAGRGH
jgi:hypothetical protein